MKTNKKYLRKLFLYCGLRLVENRPKLSVKLLSCGNFLLLRTLWQYLNMFLDILGLRVPNKKIFRENCFESVVPKMHKKKKTSMVPWIRLRTLLCFFLFFFHGFCLYLHFFLKVILWTHMPFVHKSETSFSKLFSVNIFLFVFYSKI